MVVLPLGPGKLALGRRAIPLTGARLPLYLVLSWNSSIKLLGCDWELGMVLYIINYAIYLSSIIKATWLNVVQIELVERDSMPSMITEQRQSMYKELDL